MKSEKCRYFRKLHVIMLEEKWTEMYVWNEMETYDNFLLYVCTIQKYSVKNARIIFLFN